MLAMSNTVSFHFWKFLAGIVLFGCGLLYGCVIVYGKQPFDNMGMIATAETVSMFLAAAVFFYRSVLPWSGSQFVWPDNAPVKRELWRITRQKLHWLDVALICSLLITIALYFNLFWPLVLHWQGTAFVIATTAMYVSGAALYAVRFLPDKPWIDTTISFFGFVIAIIACVTLGLQPM